MLWNIVNLNEELLFSLLYFISSMYIFAKLGSFFLYPWLAKIWLFNMAERRLFVNKLLTKLVGLIIRGIDRDIMGGTISWGSIIRVFLSLILI